MMRWGRWLLALGVIAGLAWYGDLGPRLRPAVEQLASQPEVADAFMDPESARIDALLLLVSFFLLTPAVIGLLALAVVFALVVTLLVAEPVFRWLRLPQWGCVPLVLGLAGAGAWMSRDTWLPHLLYVVALTAKAGLVFFTTPVPVPR
jgi:hypothetical protein